MGAAIKKFLSVFADAKWVGQYSHFAWAYGVVFTFYGDWTIAAFLAAASIKEFYVDKHFEFQQSFADNALDFSTYALGVVVAVIAHHFRRAL
jgi:hypothetical protein